MDTTNPIIDTDEILPEIEIREIMTIEQMQEYNNNFVAFTNNDIFILMNDLSNNNYQAFIEQYKKIIHKKPISFYDFNTIPLINAIRKNYDPDIDNPINFFELYDNALTARNYALQQIRINKISFPFDLIENFHNQLKISQPGIVLLDYPIPSLSKITQFDNEYFNDTFVNFLIYKEPHWINESYFHEYNNLFNYKINFNNKLSIKDLIDNNELNNLYKNIKDKLLPNFDYILKLINKKCDLHTLKLTLGYNSYDLDTLTKDEFQKLYDHLISLVNNDDDTDQSVYEFKLPQFKIKKSFDQFYNILLQHFSKFSIITKNENITTVLDRLNTYISNLPPSAIVLASELSNNNILNDISSNTDEIINKIRSYFNEENKNKIIKFMNDYKLLKVPDNIDNIIDLYKLIDKQYLDSCKYLSMNISYDLSNVIQGTDTTDYDGNPNNDYNLKNIHEDFEDYIEIEEDKGETDENDLAIDDAINIYKLNDTFNDDEIEDLNEGTKDILLYVMPILLKISKASGLPLDIKLIAHRLAKVILFESRASQIKKHIPDISDNLIHLICQDDFSDALNAIQDINNISVITKLQDIYPSIHKSWEKECNNTFIEGITLWWLELLELSLRGHLVFNIFDGYIEFINKWSRFGPPFEEKSKTGIIIYLCNVATNLPDISINYNDLELQKEIEKHAINKYSEKLDQLHLLWNDISNTIDTLGNIENIKLSIIEVIKLLKTGKKSKKMLPVYLSAFINLPRLIEQKVNVKTIAWAQGCCITPLNQSYEADADWRSFGSLWSLKNILSQDRFIKKRQKYVYFTPKSSDKSDDDTQKTFYIPKCISEKSDELPIEQPKYTWLPQNIITDAKIAKTSTLDILKNIYSIKNANLLIKIFDNNIKSILHCKSIIILISKVLFKYDNPIIKENNYCIEMKKYIEKLSEDDLTLAKYVIAKALCIPGTFNTNLILPTNIPVDLYTNIKKDNVKAIVNWSESITELSKEDITDFLTKMREKQKDLILTNLNELEDKEKQNLNDLKKYGLIKFTDLYREFEEDKDINIYTGILDEDAEGEADFLALPTDNDDINEDYI